MTMIYTAMLAATLLGLAACQTPAGPSTAQETGAVTLSGIANGSATLQSGQSLSVALPSNGSTGYSWQLAAYDGAVLRPDVPFGEQVTAPHAAGMVGVGGETHWSFEAAAPGTATLLFTYSQPWDKTAPPAETARYTITVR
ncbi:MAG TPA: protease inhibitor I42 family protein [Brevundimonas sp.]|jgi:inhibitor of cysteine peptidase